MTKPSLGLETRSTTRAEFDLPERWESALEPGNQYISKLGLTGRADAGGSDCRLRRPARCATFEPGAAKRRSGAKQAACAWTP